MATEMRGVSAGCNAGLRIKSQELGVCRGPMCLHRANTRRSITRDSGTGPWTLELRSRICKMNGQVGVIGGFVMKDRRSTRMVQLTIPVLQYSQRVTALTCGFEETVEGRQGT